MRSGLQSCVESIRNSANDPSSATSGNTGADDPPEVEKLKQQLDEFLRLHTALIEELVELLQEMHECVASNESVKPEQDKEKDNTETEKEKSSDDKKEEDKTEADAKDDGDSKPDDESKDKGPDDETKKTEDEKEKDETADDGKTEEKEAEVDPNAKDGDQSAKEEEQKKDAEKVDGTDIKLKLNEMNSQIKSWTKRMESIIERCATLQPTISVFPS